MALSNNSRRTISIVVPCYNEEATLPSCIEKLLAIEDDIIQLEIIIVDDGSNDNSLGIARQLAVAHPQITVLHHASNHGKGAALNTGFQQAKGEIIAIQDADLEYNPQDLRRLLNPLLTNEADVVLGSRFLSEGTHRVLYFWHSLGNRVLTFLSNMFTDLNLSDMETCYKVCKADLIKQIHIQEKGFGIEPELVAKLAHLRPRIYEMGISYHGRTYEEGKKIGWKDALWALYCIFHYNAPRAPVPIQFMIYLGVGGLSAVVNLLAFRISLALGGSLTVSILQAFYLAALLNYGLCILLLFRHKARWDPVREILIYVLMISMVAIFDLMITWYLITKGLAPLPAKAVATFLGLLLNFSGRRFIVFPEAASGPWRPQSKK